MGYNYINNEDKFLKIIEILSAHEKEVNQFFLNDLIPRLKLFNTDNEKLYALFTIANKDRRSTGKDNKSLVEATASFKKLTDDFNNISYSDKWSYGDAHEDFLKNKLCNIPGMDQKTANLFLKFIVIVNEKINLNLPDWHEWKPYLHVPLDVWVLRLLGDQYLNLCNTAFEGSFKHKDDYPSPSISSRYSNKYWKLQKDLRQVATKAGKPAILIDILWFVGNRFCVYHPLFCKVCWLNGFCSNKKIINLNRIKTTTKTQKKSDKRDYFSTLFAGLNKEKEDWLQQNPGKTQDDFFHLKFKI